MSVRSDIRRAMRPAQLEPWEDDALFVAIRKAISNERVGPGANIVVPAITKAGNAYVLTLHLRGGIIDRFEVDHDPDMDGPEMRAYLEKRAEYEAERGAPYGEEART